MSLKKLTLLIVGFSGQKLTIHHATVITENIVQKLFYLNLLFPNLALLVDTTLMRGVGFDIRALYVITEEPFVDIWIVLDSI